MGRIKEWEELTICDSFLLQKVMQNKRLCKRLIEKQLRIKVKNITYPDAEKTLEISPTQKGIRQVHQLASQAHPLLPGHDRSQRAGQRQGLH